LTQFSTILGHISFLFQTPPHSKTGSAHPRFGEYNIISYFVANATVFWFVSLHHFISLSEKLHRTCKAASTASTAPIFWVNFVLLFHL
jgi:hypothetical protein